MRIIAILFALSVCALAQDTNATLEDLVTDPSGSVISGAKIHALNTMTGYVRTQATNNAGSYCKTPSPELSARTT